MFVPFVRFVKINAILTNKDGANILYNDVIIFISIHTINKVRFTEQNIHINNGCKYHIQEISVNSYKLLSHV